ncbi:MAG: hypothetical protein P4L83_19710 [Nevskia sp.]|nr:hypothetical protein [Nevskia sp.]
MPHRRHTVPAIVVTSGTILVGCGGHSGGTYYYYGGSGCASYSACYPPDALYRGTLGGDSSGQRTPVVAIFGNNGDGRMAAQDGTYYRLTLDAAGRALRGDLAGYSTDRAFADGTRSTSGVVSGNVYPSGLDATVEDRQGNRESLSLQPTREAGGPGQPINGTWSYQTDGFGVGLTLRANGDLVAADSKGCMYKGSFSNTRTGEVYRVSYVRSCAGTIDQFSGYLAPVSASQSGAPRVQVLADDYGAQFLSIRSHERRRSL